MGDYDGLDGSYVRSPKPGAGPIERPMNRIVVRATYEGQAHQYEKVVHPDLGHYGVDKGVWDATVQVRRALVQQAYPSAILADEEAARIGLRNEFETWYSIRNHCARTCDRFELVPPERGVTDKWRAYFKKTRTPPEIPDPFWIERHPVVGVGSTERIAIENLLRATEGKEPIDG